LVDLCHERCEATFDVADRLRASAPLLASQPRWLRIERQDSLAFAMTRKHVCPKCQSKAVSRAPHEDVLERLILMLRRKQVYRCLDCDKRFYDRPLAKQRSMSLLSHAPPVDSDTHHDRGGELDARA
jgi:ribosomal protein L37AE/L43A